MPISHIVVRKGLLPLIVLGALAIAPGRLPAQDAVDLLPLDHPATRILIRFYEYGAIPEFPREHLPVSRVLAMKLLEKIDRDTLVPRSFRELARYYRDELDVDVGKGQRSVVIPTDNSPSIFNDYDGKRPIAIVEYMDHKKDNFLVLEPVLDGELRVTKEGSRKALIAQGGAQLRGSLAEIVGFSARVTNGSVAGDSSVVASDPRFSRSGTFGVTGFGRDIGFGNAHLRVDIEEVAAVEIGHEQIQLGGGLEGSLLLGSVLPSNYDYLRFTAGVGPFRYSHIHAALLGEAVGKPSGPDADIPAKYIATHLLSVGPIAGVRLSIGESVIYHGRGFEIGYLNPFLFMKSQEQYLRDRDNANMYMAISVAPINRLFLEGELMLDDLRFSMIGDGFWGNKSAWRVGARATAFPLDMVDLGLSYTRLEPYVFTHFNRLNNYTHDEFVLGAGGLEPNSHALEGRLDVTPLPNLLIRGSFSYGEHGANIIGRSSTNGDTLLFNAGGDIRQTRRAGIDSDVVRFLDGALESNVRMSLLAEYELRRSIYLRLNAFRNRTVSGAGAAVDTQIWLGLRIGAH